MKNLLPLFLAFTFAAPALAQDDLEAEAALLEGGLLEERVKTEAPAAADPLPALQEALNNDRKALEQRMNQLQQSSSRFVKTEKRYGALNQAFSKLMIEDWAKQSAALEAYKAASAAKDQKAQTKAQKNLEQIRKGLQQKMKKLSRDCDALDKEIAKLDQKAAKEDAEDRRAAEQKGE